SAGRMGAARSRGSCPSGGESATRSLSAPDRGAVFSLPVAFLCGGRPRSGRSYPLPPAHPPPLSRATPGRALPRTRVPRSKSTSAKPLPYQGSRASHLSCEEIEFPHSNQEQKMSERPPRYSDAPPVAHLDAAILIACASGPLPKAESERVHAHVSRCA